MGLNIQKAKGRKGDGRTSFSFVMLPHHLLEHAAFRKLSPNACKVLLFLASQYTGSNNGDLTIAWKIAKGCGFTSNGSLRLAAKELMGSGFAIQSRQGGRNRCSLFALTWFRIDDCDGKLDIPATKVAPNDWLFKGRAGDPPGVQLSEPATVQLAPATIQSAQKADRNHPH